MSDKNKITTDDEQYYPRRGPDKYGHEMSDSKEQDFKLKSMPMKTSDEWEAGDKSPDCDSHQYAESKKKLNQ